MAKDKVLRYPSTGRPDTIGFHLALSYPSEIEEGLERLRESLKHPDAVKQGLTEIEFLIRDFEKSAKRLLESEGEDTDYSHICYDDDISDGMRIGSAKAVIINAEILRDAIEEKNLNEALIRMLLMTAAAIRMEVFEDAMWGLHAEQYVKKAGRRSGAIRQAEAEEEYSRIVQKAKKLVRDGVAQHELSSRIANTFNRSPKSVRKILKKYGVYTNKRKST